MGLILIGNNNRFLIHRSIQALSRTHCSTLYVVVGWHVHAVAGVECRIQPVDILHKWILFVLRVEKVNRSFFVVVLLEHVDI